MVPSVQRTVVREVVATACTVNVVVTVAALVTINACVFEASLV